MAEANWYVVHTYSGYENKVKANIEKTIENRHLEDQILEVRVPMEDVVEVRNGVKKQVQRKLFPGYVLLNMVMNDDTWYVVRNTRGVTGFVGPGSKPVPLTEEEMQPLGIQPGELEVDFQEGDIRHNYRWCLERYCRHHPEYEPQQTDGYHQCRIVWSRYAGGDSIHRREKVVTGKFRK